MITITYSEYGKSNADDMSRIVAKEIIDEGSDYETSTESLIEALRLMIIKGEVSKDGIQFKFKGENIKVNELGQFEEYPEGFCDAREGILLELIMLQVDKGEGY